MQSDGVDLQKILKEEILQNTNLQLVEINKFVSGN